MGSKYHGAGSSNLAEFTRAEWKKTGAGTVSFLHIDFGGYHSQDEPPQVPPIEGGRHVSISVAARLRSQTFSLPCRSGFDATPLDSCDRSDKQSVAEARSRFDR